MILAVVTAAILLCPRVCPASTALSPVSGAAGGWLNVRAYGAKGDGKADDGPAIRAAFAAAQGGTVYFPAGVYRGGVVGNPENGEYRAVAMLPSHTRVIGDGMGASVVGLLPNQPQGATIFYNTHIGSGGDEYISLEDLTLDGFAAEQQPALSQNGLGVLRMKHLTCRHVRFRNVYGTASSGVGESFHAEFGLSTTALFEGCEVEGTAGSTASGFSADASSDITYIGCRATGMKVSCGFTHNACAHVTYIGCQSFLNPNGFNSEASTGVSYLDCTAGGMSAASPAYPYRPSTPLGNTGPYGQFIINGDHDVILQGCTAREGSSGVWVQGAEHVLIDGGDYSGNHRFGIHIDRASLPTTAVAGAPIMHDNRRADLELPTGFSLLHGPLPTPPLPLSGKAVPSPFPMNVTVYVSGSVTDIRINGASTGLRGGSVTLPPGASIAISRSGPARWEWVGN